jgi:tryptophan synthase beta chain
VIEKNTSLLSAFLFFLLREEEKMPQYKYVLQEKDLPTHWYNVLADMKQPPPPYRHPVTLELLGPDDLAPVFPMPLIMQEVSQERWIEIPDEVQDVLKMWRPTPLYRAARWEKALDTPAKIYYKWEGVSPPGSHKPNTAVAQCYYGKQEGLEGFATETGAGQWGSALCFATQIFGLKCKVFMVAISYQQKPYRRIAMETWGGKVVPSPSSETNAGRNILAVDPETSGSLGIAISEAIEYAVTHDGWKYSLGSVVNFVLLHQTVEGLESRKQMEMAGDYPDIIIGCAGGGSNAAGLIYPFLKDKLDGTKPDLRAVFVESTACPSMTKGIYAYDWGDTAKTGPVAMMHTVGHGFIPAPVHAGGLRYHGMAPSICALLDQGIAEARAYHQLAVFEAAESFAKAEGFIVAPETAHALRAVYDEAMACKESGESKVILFNNSGHGHFDLGAYDAYHRKDLLDSELDQAAIEKALAELPKVPA